VTAAALRAPAQREAAQSPDAAAAAARVLIVEDSAVARAVIARVVDATDSFVVAGVASHVRDALAFLERNTVDYILLDICLPGVDGLTALPDLIAAGGAAKVLIVSSSAADGAATTVQALALGAADTLVKPEAGALSGRFAQALDREAGAARRAPGAPGHGAAAGCPRASPSTRARCV
jgi:two-component system chemotaxis response regulator CheB